ncbi:hypothetical protein MKX01_008565 [Papaver californicum]|nr:hypothetical protein MKX01_008565 [Papaver californicum]
MKVSDDVDLRQVAEETDLFTGAELEGLCREAGMVALREDITAAVVLNRHFHTVKESLKPALTREAVDKYVSFKKNPYSRSIKQCRLNKKQQTSKFPENLMCQLKVGAISFVLVYIGCHFLKSRSYMKQ